MAFIKKYSFCLLTFLFIGSSELIGEHQEKPVLAVLNDQIELGRLSPEEKKEFNIIIQNRGDADLIIHDVRTNCGCLSAAKAWKDYVIKPGERENIVFYLLADKNSIRGLQHKRILFETNDPVSPRGITVVSYSVHHIYKIAAIPSVIDFHTIKKDSLNIRNLTLVSPFPDKLVINSIQSSSPFLHVRPKLDQNNILSFDVEISKYPGEGGEETITFNTSRGNIVVPVKSKKQEMYKCMPSKLVLKPLALNKYDIRRLVITSLSGEAFEITSLVCESKDIKIESEYETESSPRHVIKLKFSSMGNHEGVGEANIVVTVGNIKSTINCVYYIP